MHKRYQNRHEQYTTEIRVWFMNVICKNLINQMIMIFCNKESEHRKIYVLLYVLKKTFISRNWSWSPGWCLSWCVMCTTYRRSSYAALWRTVFLVWLMTVADPQWLLGGRNHITSELESRLSLCWDQEPSKTRTSSKQSEGFGTRPQNRIS